MRELLSNNSLFVGQLYEDKSLAIRARDLISFTTDLYNWPPNSVLLLKNSLLRLIYFLNVSRFDGQRADDSGMSYFHFRLNNSFR